MNVKQLNFFAQLLSFFCIVSLVASSSPFAFAQVGGVDNPGTQGMGGVSTGNSPGVGGGDTSGVDNPGTAGMGGTSTGNSPGVSGGAGTGDTSGGGGGVGSGGIGGGVNTGYADSFGGFSSGVDTGYADSVSGFGEVNTGYADSFVGFNSGVDTGYADSLGEFNSGLGETSSVSNTGRSMTVSDVGRALGEIASIFGVSPAIAEPTVNLADPVEHLQNEIQDARRQGDVVISPNPRTQAEFDAAVEAGIAFDEAKAASTDEASYSAAVDSHIANLVGIVGPSDVSWGFVGDDNVEGTVAQSNAPTAVSPNSVSPVNADRISPVATGDRDRISPVATSGTSPDGEGSGGSSPVGGSDTGSAGSVGGTQDGTSNDGVAGGEGVAGGIEGGFGTIGQINPNPGGENQTATVVDPTNARNLAPAQTESSATESETQATAQTIASAIENNDINENDVTEGSISAEDAEDVVNAETENTTSQSSLLSHPAVQSLAQVILNNILTADGSGQGNHVAPNQSSGIGNAATDAVSFVVNNPSFIGVVSPAAADGMDAPTTVGRFTTVNITGPARPGDVNQSYVDKMDRALTALQQKYPGLQVTIFSGTHIDPNHDPAKDDGKPSGRHAHGNGGDTTFSINGNPVRNTAILADIAQTLANVDPGVGIGYNNRSRGITHVDFEPSTRGTHWGYGGGVPAAIARALANGRAGTIATGAVDPLMLRMPDEDDGTATTNVDDDSDVPVPTPQSRPVVPANLTEIEEDTQDENDITIDDVLNQADDDGDTTDRDSSQEEVGITPTGTNNEMTVSSDVTPADFPGGTGEGTIGPNPSEVDNVIDNGFPAAGTANQDNKRNMEDSQLSEESSTETDSAPPVPSDPIPAPAEPAPEPTSPTLTETEEGTVKEGGLFGIQGFTKDDLATGIDAAVDAFEKARNFFNGRSNQNSNDIAGSGFFERTGQEIQHFGRNLFQGNSSQNARFTEQQRAVSTKPYVPIHVTINETSGHVAFERGAIQNENFETYDTLEPVYETFEEAPQSLIVSPQGDIIYSDGTYAPRYENGQPIGDDEIDYLYFIERVNADGIKDAETNEKVLPGNMFTNIFKRIFSDTSPFTLNDVETVTYEYIDPDTGKSDDEYRVYTISLTDGSDREVVLPVTTSFEFYKKQVAATGYNGDVFALIELGEEVKRTEREHKPNVLEQVLTKIRNTTNDIASVFSRDDEGDVFANLPHSPEAIDYQFNDSNLVDATIYLNTPLPCPNTSNHEHGYAYEIVARDTSNNNHLVFYGALCGTGSPQTYAQEVANDIVENGYFENVRADTIFNVLDFRFYYAEDTRERSNVSDSSAGDQSNEINDIVFQAKVTTDRGQTIRDWSGRSPITVQRDHILHFRWNAETYSRCLPFLNDNGSYSLRQGSDLRMTTGNTETEEFLITKESGTYRIQCDGQEVNESDVHEKKIEVIVE